MKPFIIVWVNKVYHKIEIETIVFVKAESNYCHIYTSNGRNYMVYISLKEITELLQESGLFISTNRSHLVNIDFVDTFSCDEGVRFKIAIKDVDSVPLSEKKIDALHARAIQKELSSMVEEPTPLPV